MQEILNTHFKKIGWEAQKKLSPLQRKDYSIQEIKNFNPKQAAVLFLMFLKDETWYFPLIKRTTYNGHHSNQISLPGGKPEPSDINLQYTARRETKEEIGVTLPKNTLLKELSFLYIPPSNFLVSPFLALHTSPISFKKEEKEVEKIIQIRLTDLLNAKIKYTTINKLDAPYFKLENQIVWGATAMILNEVKEILNSLPLPLQ